MTPVLARRDESSVVGASAATSLDAALPFGSSPGLADALAFARRVAARPRLTVLISGETGTGKELLARWIHEASVTAREPFVALNCSAIPETLLESELFGHEAGAYTDARRDKRGLIEAAGGGTLFLDEIGDLPLSLQPKLLRVLEERRFRRLGGTDEHEVRCRVIAATNVDFDAAIERGRFREDLFYRLNVFRIDLPPLRERRADVVPLAEYFLAEIARENGERPQRLDERARESLRAHHWAGNVRELRNVIERASILAPGGVITTADLRLQHREVQVPVPVVVDAAHAIAIPPDGKSLAEIEREAIRVTMLLTSGNLSAAARILGISRPTLLRKMRASGMTRRSLLASS